MRRNVAIGVVLVLLLALVVWWKFLRGGDDPSAVAGGSAGSGSAAIGSTKTSAAKSAAIKVTLSGRVTRKSDGSGVAGAFISVTKKATIEAIFNRIRGTDDAPLATADKDGRWKLENIDPGSYTLGATGAALLPASRVISVGTSSMDNIDFVLDAGGAIASGTVSDVLGGPIPGAKVQARRNRNNPFANDADIVAFTDDKGMYQLALPPGDLVFVASHEAYTGDTRFVEMTNESIVVDFTLTPGATIRGQVVTTDGKPVPGVNVAASPEGGPPINIASFAAGDVTDEKGEFTLKSLSPGALSLTASGSGYSTVSPTVVEVGIGEQVDGVRVVVEKGLSISGRVVEKGTTKGIAGVRVGVFSIAASQAGMGHEPSGEDGSFVIEGLRPAPYMVFAIGDEVMPEVGKSVELVDKDVKDVIVEMATGVTITGFVQPGTVASVSIQPTMVGLGNMFEIAKSVLVRAESDETGAFTLRHAPPGAFTLEAETKDGRAGEIPIVIENVDKSGVVVKLDERASIAGRVIDATGAAVTDVEVHASKREKDRGNFNFRMGNRGGGNSVRTRKDGTFLIVGLDEGKHEVRVTDGRGRLAWASPPNKDKPSAPIEMDIQKAEKKTNVTLTVETRDGSIRGVVVLPDGKPAPDTWISITKDRPKKADDKKPGEDIDYDEMRGSWRGGDIAPVITNAEGRFSIEKLRRGTYKVVGENAKGSARGQKEGVKTGETITLQLGRLGTLTGKVTVEGSPVSPYDIDCDPVVREGWSSHEKRVTEKTGAYTLERLPPAEYACNVTADAGQATAKVTVPAGDATLDIALVPWATVSGTVVSVLTGQPVEGVKLIASATGRGIGDRQSLTDLLGGKGPTSDAGGAFTVPRVSPGPGELMVMPATGGFRPLAQQKFEAKAGQKVDVGAIKIIPPRTGEAGTLGIGTDAEGDKLTVADVKEGGPGQAAGVLVGDRIVTINGIDVATLTPAIAQALIGSGNMDVGQKFLLGIERAGAVQQVTVVAVKW